MITVDNSKHQRLAVGQGLRSGEAKYKFDKKK